MLIDIKEEEYVVLKFALTIADLVVHQKMLISFEDEETAKKFITFEHMVTDILGVSCKPIHDMDRKLETVRKIDADFPTLPGIH